MFSKAWPKKSDETSIQTGVQNVVANNAQDIGTVVAQHPIAVTAVIAGAGIAIGAVALARKIKDSLLSLSSEDLARYRELVQAKSVFSNNHLPKEWILTEKKHPTHRLDFEETAHRLKAEAAALSQVNSYDYDTRATLLSHIGDLFNSMNKRSTVIRRAVTANFAPHKIRVDGIEVMFFSDLADWLLCDADKLPPTDPNTILEYKKLLDYCNSVRLKVITNDSSEKSRNNPHAALVRIIGVLQNYHDKLKELQSAMTFNHLIVELENHLLGLSSRALNVLYLLIDKTPSTALMVDRFMSPESTDKKYLAIRNTQLGEWLYQTMAKVGLSHSKFKSNTVLTTDDIAQHLVDEHPNDERFVKPKRVWGYHPFSEIADDKHPNGKQKAHAYLQQIRTLQRLVVELYYLNQNLVKSSKVSAHFGDTWLYGHAAGKAALMELLLSTTEVTDDYFLSLKDFWKAFYEEDFADYAKRKYINTRKKEYVSLIHIQEKLIGEISGIKEQIDTYIQRIYQQAKEYARHADEIEQTKVVFIASVLEHRRFRNKANTENCQIAEAELHRLKQPRSVPPTKPSRPFAPSVPLITYRLLEVPGSVSPVPSDGNCFFHAIHHERVRLKLGNESHAELRAMGIKYLEDTLEIMRRHPPENETPEQYLKRMREDKVHAEGPIIEALLLKLKIQLTVCEISTNAQGVYETHIFHLNADKVDNHGTVGVVLKDKHYNALALGEPTQIEVSEWFGDDEEIVEDGEMIVNSGLYQALTGTAATNIVCKRGELSLFESSTVILLDNVREIAPLFDMEYKLFSKPEKFYSKLQERIYLQFLVPNQAVVSNYWWLSIFQNISPYQIEAFTELYKRINTLMKMIYFKPNGALAPKPTTLEIIMLDTLLYNTINEAFKTRRYYNFTLTWEDSPLEIVQTAKQFEVSFDIFKTSVLREELTNIIKKSMITLDEKDKRIEALTKEREELQRQLAKKDEVIEEQKAQLDEQAVEIDRISQSNDELRQQFSALEAKMLAKRANKKANRYAMFPEGEEKKQEPGAVKRPVYGNNTGLY